MRYQNKLRPRGPIAIAQILRGIVLESMGVAVLIFLYLSINISADTGPVVEHQPTQAKVTATSAATPAATPAASLWTNPYATAKLKRVYQLSAETNLPLPVERAPWATWRN